MAAPVTELEAIKEARVLMVGAGGIGCELLKTLVMTGFRDIELIDLDTIDVSNLNRQFLFRKRHVGMSKAKVAREAALNLRPDTKIVAHHGNVKDAEFSVDFFQSFDVVLGGLDNADARRHVNRLCLAAGVPLVESGTTGYNGQVDVHIKGLTGCYECQPKPVPKSYPTCTITNTPSKPVHCIVWAKELPFQKLFGECGQANDLDIRTDEESEEGDRHFFELREGETGMQFARRVFDRIFGFNIARTLEMDDLWKNRARPTPLYVNKILPGTEDIVKSQTHDDEPVGGRGSAEGLVERRVTASESGVVADEKVSGNGTSEHESAVAETRPEDLGGRAESGTEFSAMANLGLRNPQEVWSVEDNARIFLESVRIFVEERRKEIGSLSFDKDDQLAVEFVTSAANLRSHSFGIPTQSLFDAKGIAGNIIHAVATTNAIVAGLIVLEAIKVITKKFELCRNVWCNEFPMGRGCLVMPAESIPRNPKCYVCSQAPLLLEVNTRSATLGEVLDKIVRRRLAVSSPMVTVGNSLLYEAGEDLEEDEIRQYETNSRKKLIDFSVPIKSGSVISIEDYHQQFKCALHVKHREDFNDETEPEGMVLHGEVSKALEAADTKEGEGAGKEEEADEEEIEVWSQEAAGDGSKRKREGDGGEKGKKRSKAGSSS